ncbi:MAG: hypothetical protein E7311_02410 [Clostridiales bacterium]|nr:hypothetical protein [Clostridiales bacterium]
MKKRNKKIDYSILTDIDIWKLVKANRISRFPANFWNKDSFKNIFRYICLELYKFSKEDICNIRLKFFLKEECLITGIDIFNKSSFELLSYCFPELEIKEWELILVPKDFWNEDTIKRAINWLSEKEGLCKREDLINNFSTNLLKKNKLATLTSRYSLQYLLNLCFPEYDIKKWELRKIDKWSDELCHEAINWFLKKENLNTRKDICERFSGNLLEKNGLSGMLSIKFGYSSIKVLEFEFPGEYKKEDLKAYRNYV